MADAPLVLLVTAPALMQRMPMHAHLERLHSRCRVPHAESVANLDEPGAAAAFVRERLGGRVTR